MFEEDSKVKLKEVGPYIILVKLHAMHAQKKLHTTHDEIQGQLYTTQDVHNITCTTVCLRFESLHARTDWKVNMFASANTCKETLHYNSM